MGEGDGSALFLTSACESIIISKRFEKTASVACAAWTALPSTFLAPPYLPVPLVYQGTQNSPAPRTWLFLLPRTPLPLGNLPPSSLFLSSRTGSGPEEEPTALTDLRLDAPVVDEAWQQLLLLVTLVGGGRQRFGQLKKLGHGLWLAPVGPPLRPSVIML